MSPFAMTGIEISFLICAIVSYSAAPLKRHARVRPCTAIAVTPVASAIFAISTPLR